MMIRLINWRTEASSNISSEITSRFYQQFCVVIEGWRVFKLRFGNDSEELGTDSFVVIFIYVSTVLDSNENVRPYIILFGRKVYY
jgi:hypothetical protein